MYRLMSDSQCESEGKETTIFEIYCDNSKDVYHVVSESNMKTRVSKTTI